MVNKKLIPLVIKERLRHPLEYLRLRFMPSEKIEEENRRLREQVSLMLKEMSEEEYQRIREPFSLLEQELQKLREDEEKAKSRPAKQKPRLLKPRKSP